jgi:SHS2 domain-containing protein
MKDYEFIEHTADVGIKVKGKNLKEIFINTALAMFDIMAERKSKIKNQKSKITIEQRAENLEELFVNWLNELLFLSATKGLIFTNFKINRLDKNNLEAMAIGENIKNYRINTEIKAATYHELKIEKKDSHWQAQIIFDV